MAVQGLFRIAGKARASLFYGQERCDLAVAHRHGVVLEHHARGLDRNDPARAEEEVRRYLGVPWMSISTRRFGARQSISLVRGSFSSQALTGRASPKAKVAICPRSTPLDTR